MNASASDPTVLGHRVRGIELAVFFVLVLGTFALYARTAGFDFINYDDPDYVYENPHVREGLSWSNVSWALTATAAGNWHPLTWLSLMTDVSLFGVRPGPMHLVNAAMHALSAGLLFCALRSMTASRWPRTWPSAWVAAMFAVHPLHVESVAWIAERKDSLSTLLWIACMLAYVGYVRKRSRWRYALVLTLLALGLMAKPMLVTLPFVLLLLDYWPLTRVSTARREEASGNQTRRDIRIGLPLREAILEKLPMLALVLVSCAITYRAQSAGNAVQSDVRFPTSVRLENAAISYVAYLSKTFVPRGLSIYYPHPAITSAQSISLMQLSALFAAALLLAITLAAIRLRKSQPWLLVGWVWYLGTLVPVIGIVQVGSQAMADRYTYVPLIGIFIALAWTAACVARGSAAVRGIVTAIAIASVAACAALGWRQIGYWRDSETLFRHALDVNPDNPAANNNLGTMLASRGQRSEAAEYFRRAIAAMPDNPLAHRNLARVYADSGEIETAIAELAEALRLSENAGNNHPHALAFDHNLLGRMLLSRGRRGEALVHLQRAAELEPDNPKYAADLNALRR